jgi:hypothetical protein
MHGRRTRKRAGLSRFAHHFPEEMRSENEMVGSYLFMFGVSCEGGGQ